MEQFVNVAGLVVIVVLGFMMGVKFSGKIKGRK